ncbi:MAG: cytochrome c3 family protein [Deltaproteobacteria bacterium]|nr:cytochrome c3 family protein [Deltaproteobacteria bacterium]
MRRAIGLAAVVLLTSSPALAGVGGGDVTFKMKAAKNSVFSHEAHVEGVGLQCTECHDNVFTNSAGHKKTTMKQMQQGRSCGACHNGKKAFSVKADCAKCHQG